MAATEVRVGMADGVLALLFNFRGMPHTLCFGNDDDERRVVTTWTDPQIVDWAREVLSLPNTEPVEITRH